MRLKYSIFLLIACGFFAFGVQSAKAQQNASAQTVQRSDPFAILRSAQTIFIRTKTVYFKPAALEEALLERTEFERWNFVVSREETDADLIIEVDRKLFTNTFVYSVIDPKGKRVLLGGKIGSLGGTVEGQIANGFVKRLEKIRPLPPENKLN